MNIYNELYINCECELYGENVLHELVECLLFDIENENDIQLKHDTIVTLEKVIKTIKQMVIENVAPVIFQSIFYKLLLEVALGANASTLMTMRSAYDTATEYCEQLESEINRQRQSAVTADVLETASEFTE